MMINNNKVLNSAKGKLGEAKATEYLKSKGYKILVQNFKTKIGEIDIIASKDNFVVFVEVKARKNSDFGLPREAVNYYKQRKIRMVATQYLKSTNKLNTPCRFDVVEILGDKIEHIENCF